MANPVLTNPRANFVTLTSVIPSVHTDSVGGFIYMVLITDLVAIPNASQVKAGQNGFGTSVPNENIAVTLGGTQTFTQLDGLTNRTDYALYYVHEDASGNTSEVSSIAFDTLKPVADIEETFPDDEGGISGSIFDFWTWDDDHIDFIGWDAETVIGSEVEVEDGGVVQSPSPDTGGISPT